MSQMDNGGPAFPQMNQVIERRGDKVYTFAGMSLRDYFATAALTGLCARQGMVLQRQSSMTGNHMEISAMAFIYADAMLKERAK